MTSCKPSLFQSTLIVPVYGMLAARQLREKVNHSKFHFENGGCVTLDYWYFITHYHFTCPAASILWSQHCGKTKLFRFTLIVPVHGMLAARQLREKVNHSKFHFENGGCVTLDYWYFITHYHFTCPAASILWSQHCGKTKLFRFTLIVPVYGMLAARQLREKVNHSKFILKMAAALHWITGIL
jgi:hypothetical protein